MSEITVVIPTYNPDLARLRATLAGLEAQTLPDNKWEVVIVDNSSSTPVDPYWCQQYLTRPHRVVTEPVLGLSSARRCGIRASSSEIIVFSDDDNVLARDYLEKALQHFAEFELVGAAGGKSLPRYEEEPPEWYRDGIAPMGCRDLGDERLVLNASEYAAVKRYPKFAPIGAGMVFRKVAMESWLENSAANGISDRKGDSLSSAGDCDMTLSALDAGWSVAYWPDLKLTHLIPAERLSVDYLAKVARCAHRDFVRVLNLHGIYPWPESSRWTIPLRVARAWIRIQPWRGPVQKIQFNSAVGQFEGRVSFQGLKCESLSQP